MPPKKKGKGKKSGKKSGGKKKKGKKSVVKEPKMTAEEAILSFQIEIKERAMEDLLYELKVMKDKNERLKDRNTRLKDEQLMHIKTLLKQAKEKDKEVEKAVEVNHEEVEKALLSKFDLIKSEERELQNKREEIEKKEKEIEEVRKAIRKRQEYRDYGRHEHGKQIALLQQELDEMEESHSDIAAHIEKSLKISKEEIEAYTDNTLAKQKDIASEKAANSLDKYSRTEILDNRWLKREVALHQEGHTELVKIVEDLEKTNLEIMAELFDCKIDDLKFTRKFYLACIEDEENSDEEEEGEGEEILAKEGMVGEQTEKPDDLLENYFLPGEDNFEDSPRLGPMELQLMTVTGRQMPIHKVGEEHCNALVPVSNTPYRPDGYSDPKSWPVTNQMLQSMITQ
ncbi:coiled-coil domain-containing protein 83 [Nematostella vectensis]|uniref:coiled-coil domain-containing protein 83 n=1 Tax=Nematostella vectensis TaxID=45351 RepID=UPI00138FD8BB|nr:coiled-coil domain-containing protein 83 [Nematostella vectensis]